MTPALGSPTLTLPSSFVLSPNAKIREIHIGSVHQLPSGVYDIPTQYPIAETVDDATAMPSLRLDSSMSSAGGEIFAPQVKFTKPAASNKNTRLTSTNSFACDSVKESPATEALVSIGSNEADVATPLQMEISIKTLADVGPYTLRCVSPSASPATALTRIMSGMLKQVSPEKKRQRDRRALDARKRLAAQKETHEAEHAKAEKRRAELGPFTDEYRRLMEFTRSGVLVDDAPRGTLSVSRLLHDDAGRLRFALRGANSPSHAQIPSRSQSAPFAWIQLYRAFDVYPDANSDDAQKTVNGAVKAILNCINGWETSAWSATVIHDRGEPIVEFSAKDPLKGIKVVMAVIEALRATVRPLNVDRVLQRRCEPLKQLPPKTSNCASPLEVRPRHAFNLSEEETVDTVSTLSDMFDASMSRSQRKSTTAKAKPTEIRRQRVQREKQEAVKVLTAITSAAQELQEDAPRFDFEAIEGLPDEATVLAAVVAPAPARPLGETALIAFEQWKLHRHKVTRHAVVVSVSRYEHGLSPLPVADEVAVMLQKQLTAHGYDVDWMRVESATSDLNATQGFLYPSLPNVFAVLHHLLTHTVDEASSLIIIFLCRGLQTTAKKKRAAFGESVSTLPAGARALYLADANPLRLTTHTVLTTDALAELSDHFGIQPMVFVDTWATAISPFATNPSAAKKHLPYQPPRSFSFLSTRPATASMFLATVPGRGSSEAMTPRPAEKEGTASSPKLFVGRYGGGGLASYYLSKALDGHVASVEHNDLRGADLVAYMSRKLEYAGGDVVCNGDNVHLDDDTLDPHVYASPRATAFVVGLPSAMIEARRFATIAERQATLGQPMERMPFDVVLKRIMSQPLATRIVEMRVLLRVDANGLAPFPLMSAAETASVNCAAWRCVHQLQAAAWRKLGVLCIAAAKASDSCQFLGGSVHWRRVHLRMPAAKVAPLLVDSRRLRELEQLLVHHAHTAEHIARAFFAAELHVVLAALPGLGQPQVYAHECMAMLPLLGWPTIAMMMPTLMADVGSAAFVEASLSFVCSTARDVRKLLRLTSTQILAPSVLHITSVKLHSEQRLYMHDRATKLQTVARGWLIRRRYKRIRGVVLLERTKRAAAVDAYGKWFKTQLSTHRSHQRLCAEAEEKRERHELRCDEKYELFDMVDMLCVITESLEEVRRQGLEIDADFATLRLAELWSRTQIASHWFLRFHRTYHSHRLVVTEAWRRYYTISLPWYQRILQIRNEFRRKAPLLIGRVGTFRPLPPSTMYEEELDDDDEEHQHIGEAAAKAKEDAKKQRRLEQQQQQQNAVSGVVLDTAASVLPHLQPHW
jgi:hypothetical protein